SGSNDALHNRAFVRRDLLETKMEFRRQIDAGDSARVNDAFGAARQNESISGLQPDLLWFQAKSDAIADDFEHANSATAHESRFDERFSQHRSTILHESFRDVFAPLVH